MKLSCLAPAICTLSPLVWGIVVPSASTPGRPSVVSLNLERGSRLSPLERHRLRRRGKVEATLDNLDTLYFVNATLGTPAQPVRLHLDTGSSDLWVNTPSSVLCSDVQNGCGASGTYIANQSVTYEYLGGHFNISYVDGSGASGDYVTDRLVFADVTLDDFQFGVGYVSTAAQGILGIGYPVNEVQVARAGRAPYDNLPARLKAGGRIRASAYSLYLNDLDASTGSLLFGGVDTEQYSGELATLPVQPQGRNGDVYAEFLVTLTGLQLGSRVLGSDMALAVLLDSGSSLTYLPDDVASEIFSLTGAVYDEQEGVAFVPCSLADQPASGDAAASLDFTFTSPRIRVEMDELVIDLFDSRGRRLAFSNGVEACLFGIAPSGSGTNVLGDTFLRSAYVVFDLENNEISLAQSAFNATASNFVEIKPGVGGVPSAVPVSNPVKATTGLRQAADPPENSATRALGSAVAMVVFAGLLGLLVA